MTKILTAKNTRPTANGTYIIPPGVPQHWLETYLSPKQAPGGRPWRQSGWREDAYAAAMKKKGGWKLGPNSIGFDTDGWIIDGANRLRAAVKAQVPFTSRITIDNDPEAFSVTDTGWRRDHKQMFTVAGYKNATICAAIAIAQKQYEFGWPSVRPSSVDLLEWAEPNWVSVESAAAWGAAERKLSQGWCSPSIIAWVYWRLAEDVDQEYAEEFVAPFVTGESLKRGDPRLALRRQLLAQMTSKLSGGGTATRYSKIELQAMLVIAHNKYISGETVSKLMLPRRTGSGMKSDRGDRKQKAPRRRETWPQLEYGE